MVIATECVQMMCQHGSQCHEIKMCIKDTNKKAKKKNALARCARNPICRQIKRNKNKKQSNRNKTILNMTGEKNNNNCDVESENLYSKHTVESDS